MAYTNNSGQVRIGVRSPGVAAIVTTSTLLTSLYSVWNGDTTTSTLDSSIYGAWNGETTSTVTTLNSSVYAAWNGENTLNDSFGTKNGTAVGSVTYATGKVGSNSFSFNGSSYVQLPTSTLNITGDFTVNMWVKVNSTTTTNQGLIGNWKAGYNTGWEILFNNGWLQAFGGNLTTGTSGFLAQAPSGNISGFLNTWRMVTFVYKSGVSSYFYVDSIKGGVTNHSFTITPTTVSNGRIGSEPQDNYHLNGNIDAVTIWNRALSDTEVSALYNQSNGLQYSFPSSISVDIPSANDSVGTNHGTLMNGCTFTTGKLGQAFTFDGVNDYVALPNNSLNLTGDFTISFWVNLSSLTGHQFFISNVVNQSSLYRGFAIVKNNTTNLINVQFYNSNSSVDVFSSSAMVANTWYNIVLTRKSGVSTKLYVNGVLSGSNTSTMDPNYYTSQACQIGGYNNTASPATYFTNGNIDSLTTWNKAISQDEVTQLYNLGTGTQYPFSGQTLPSANNQFAIDNGTLMNGCTFTDGKIGKAFTFDGVNDMVTLPNNSLNINGDFSASAWVKYTIGSGIKTILSNNALLTSPTRQYGWGLYLNSNNILFQTYDGTSTVGGLSYAATLTSGTWYHITVTKSGTTKRIYLNGTEVANASVNNITYTATHRPTIGGQRYDATDMEYFSVSPIDAVNVWNKELTASEITELYNSGAGKQLTVATPIVTNGLVLNLDASRLSSYPNAGTTWTDISESGNNGTMVNGPVFGTASGGVITFDGVNDYVNITNKSKIINTDFTYDFWFKVNSNPNTYQTLISQVNGDYADYSILGKNRSGAQQGNIYFQLQGFTLQSNLSATGLIAAGNINYTAVAKKEGTYYKMYLYQNGVLDNSLNTTLSTLNMDNWLNLQTNIGRNSSNNGFYGEYLGGNIYVGRVYNKALSTTEITQNFNATKSRFGL